MTARPGRHLIELTAEQAAVVAGLARGEDFPEIARETGLSVQAARLRARIATESLGAKNRAHLVALAIGHGLIPADTATRTRP